MTGDAPVSATNASQPKIIYRRGGDSFVRYCIPVAKDVWLHLLNSVYPSLCFVLVARPAFPARSSPGIALLKAVSACVGRFLQDSRHRVLFGDAGDFLNSACTSLSKSAV